MARNPVADAKSKARYHHLRVRPPGHFSRLRVVPASRVSDEELKHARKKLRKRSFPKGTKVTVGKFYAKITRGRPKGKRGDYLAWGIQSVLVPKTKKRKTTKRKAPKKNARRKANTGQRGLPSRPQWIERKRVGNKYQYRHDGKGRWYSERNTDLLTSDGTYPVYDAKTKLGVATWYQGAFGHSFEPPPRGRRTADSEDNPPPIAVIVNPSTSAAREAEKRFYKFHGAGTRAPRKQKIAGNRHKGPDVFLVLVGPARELKCKGKAREKLRRGSKAYTTPSGDALIITNAPDEVLGTATEYARAEFVTYEGPRWSETKAGDAPAGTWWQHKCGPGVKVYRTESGRTWVLKGGQFRVTNWLHD